MLSQQKSSKYFKKTSPNLILTDQTSLKFYKMLKRNAKTSLLIGIIIPLILIGAGILMVINHIVLPLAIVFLTLSWLGLGACYFSWTEFKFLPVQGKEIKQDQKIRILIFGFFGLNYGLLILYLLQIVFVKLYNDHRIMFNQQRKKMTKK